MGIENRRVTVTITEGQRDAIVAILKEARAELAGFEGAVPRRLEAMEDAMNHGVSAAIVDLEQAKEHIYMLSEEDVSLMYEQAHGDEFSDYGTGTPQWDALTPEQRQDYIDEARDNVEDVIGNSDWSEAIEQAIQKIDAGDHFHTWVATGNEKFMCAGEVPFRCYAYEDHVDVCMHQDDQERYDCSRDNGHDGDHVPAKALEDVNQG